jgi:DNA-binding NarL/FixJ family response regulator/class 3 adenylate cyclase
VTVAGTTTILYTDLCGSSDLQATIGDEAYAATFSAHVAMIRTEVESRGGRISKLLGDGVLALFDSAHAGVTAAVTIQQMVDRANRRGNGPALGVREGLAVGEVVVAEDDLFGTALVLGRRLCDSAGAGEILVSDLVRALVEGRVDVTLEPAGERTLKGIPDVVRASAVRWDPLPIESPLRVIVADDATLIRAGVVHLLSDAGFVVIAEAGDAEELLAAVTSDPPDLVVTDIRMPPTHTNEGLVAAATIRAEHPEVAVMVLSQHVEGRSAAALLDGRPAGIGYLLKERVSELDDFVDACREVASGGSVIDQSVTEQLLRRRRDDRVLDSLSTREREVLALMAQGRSNQAIADELVVGAKTVETHVRAIFQKLGVEESPTGNRRVRAVLRWLQSDAEAANTHDH